MGKQQMYIKFNPVISIANKYLEHITTYADLCWQIIFFFFKNWYFIKFPELEITKHIRWIKATRFKSSTLFCRSVVIILWIVGYFLFNVSRVSCCGRTTCFRVKRGRRSSLFCQLHSNTSKNPVTWTPSLWLRRTLAFLENQQKYAKNKQITLKIAN